MSYNFLDKSGLTYFWEKIKGKFLQLSGGTMTGQLKTSFKSSVAIGSYQAVATTIPALVEEVRYSSGCMGSANITTEYLGTIGTDWYNFIWIPHRSGGVNGTDGGGDNVKYGNLLLCSMTTNKGVFRVRCVNGSIVETVRISDANNIYEAYLKWGGKNIAADISPNDMGCIDEFGHNKLAFLPASCIDVAYSTDGGTTWVDYGLTDTQKVAMVTTSGPAMVTGGSTTATSDNVTQHKLRVRIACGTVSGSLKLYTSAKKFLLNISNNGASATVTIRRRTIANYMSNTDTWTNVGTYNIAGGSGWNSIPFIMSFGGSMQSQTTQVGQVEFVFNNLSLGTWSYKKVQLMDIRLIGSTNWSYPSEIARAGHLYTMDTSQNATFPAKVTATTFNGALSGNATSATKATQDSDGNAINTTYVKKTADGMSAGINQLSTGNSTPTDNDYYVSQYVGGGTTTTSYHRRPMSALWEYIKGKINADGYTKNSGTVTSVAVKMNNTTKGTVTTSGTIDLGTVITSHQDISGLAPKASPTFTGTPKAPTATAGTNTTQIATTAFVQTAVSGKQNTLATQTAYTSKGSATKVPQITTNTLGQVTGITEVTITQPTVNNGTLTIQKNGTNVQTFTANQSSNVTANISVPTATSDLTNDSNFTTESALLSSSAFKQAIVELIYPVGSLYITDQNDSDHDPNNLFPGTVWVRTCIGRALTGALDSDYTGPIGNNVNTFGALGWNAGWNSAFQNKSMGGQYVHTLTASEMPAHTHSTYIGGSNGSGYVGVNGSPVGTKAMNTATSSTGGGAAHPVIQPYEAYMVWRRDS